MNPYVKNLDRIEFLVTLACSGRCKHCSEGEHRASGEVIDGALAAETVRALCGAFPMKSLMTFGGEPLLHPKTVCTIHAAARECGIAERSLITNGFFSKDREKIAETALALAESGVNGILLSADAFHQETIPLKPVMAFAEAVKKTGVPIRTHPAWLGGREADNPYNRETRAILEEFERIGIFPSEGNVIFPRGNALRYLAEYFDPNAAYDDPYAEAPDDIRAVCVSPNGDVLGGNLNRSGILTILEEYAPPAA